MAFKKNYFSNISNGVNRSALKQKANPERKPFAEMTDEEIEQARNNIARLKDRQGTERTRVDNVRSNIGKVLSEQIKKKNKGADLVPRKSFDYVNSVAGAGCIGTACAVAREAGATATEDADFKFLQGQADEENGDPYWNWNDISGGEEQPIVTSNIVFDRYADQMGWSLQDRGTEPQEGDLFRDNYDDPIVTSFGDTESPIYGQALKTIYDQKVTKGKESQTQISNTDHAALYSGGKSYYNTGDINIGLKSSSSYNPGNGANDLGEKTLFVSGDDGASISEEEYKKQLKLYNENPKSDLWAPQRFGTDRIMRYTGNTPKYTKEYRDADKKLNNYFSQRIQKGMAKLKTGIKTQGFSLMSKEEMTKGAKKSLLGNK